MKTALMCILATVLAFGLTLEAGASVVGLEGDRMTWEGSTVPPVGTAAPASLAGFKIDGVAGAASVDHPVLVILVEFADQSAVGTTETDWETPSFEGQVSVMPTAEVTAKVGFAAEDMGEEFKSELNAWASYAKDALTLAVEIDVLSNWAVPDTDTTESALHYLGMANYGLTNKIAVTGRYSAFDGDVTGLNSEFAVSPSYVISDNCGVLAEVRYNIDAETTEIAVEQIFTF